MFNVVFPFLCCLNYNYQQYNYQQYKTALNYIADNYNSDFAKLLIRYSKVNTLMNNFIIKLPDLIDPNNLMHTRFIPTGTVTLTKVTK